MPVLTTEMGEKSDKLPAKLTKETLLIAQDLKYARRLSENRLEIRHRTLKHLKEYLRVRSQKIPWTEDNLKILWKGLFYSMWMSDKPLMQEECAEHISNLIHLFNTFEESLLFFKVGLITLQNEWIGIGQLRLDKFLMCTRRLLRQAYFVLEKNNFKKKCNCEFGRVLEDTILNVNEKPPLGLFMHFTEIYLEELGKVAGKKLVKHQTIDFIMPFIKKLAYSTDSREIKWISKFILIYLIKQHNLGLEYNEKYLLWRSLGFPGSINQIQKVPIKDSEQNSNEEEIESPDNQETVLDPRAGRVDVELSQIPFSEKEISDALLSFTADQKTSTVARNVLTSFGKNFKKLSEGTYPFTVKTINSKKTKNDNYDMNVTKAAKRLIKFEQKLMGKKKNKKRERIETENNEQSKLEARKEKKRNISKEANINEGPKEKKRKTDEDKNCVRKQSILTPNTKKKIEKIDKLINKGQQIKKIPELKSLSDDADVEYVFKRNSGVWVVTSEANEESIVASRPNNMLLNLGLSPKNSSPVAVEEWTSNPIEPNSDVTQSAVSLESDSKYDVVEEQEIFIPSKKYLAKLKKTKSEEEIHQFYNKIKGKSRRSLGSITPSPTKQNKVSQTPDSNSNPKKVRINTKLNVSQEIHEHISQVISSPQIPYDSSKKPVKPVLKTPVKGSPVNPFYKLRMF